AVDAAYFTDLIKSKTLLLKGEDHDVFGDGTVVIKFTPGHTRPPVAFLETRQDRTGVAVGRLVSLSRRDDLQANPVLRFRYGADRQEPGHDRGVRQEEQ